MHWILWVLRKRSNHHVQIQSPVVHVGPEHVWTKRRTEETHSNNVSRTTLSQTIAHGYLLKMFEHFSVDCTVTHLTGSAEPHLAVSCEAERWRFLSVCPGCTEKTTGWVWPRRRSSTKFKKTTKYRDFKLKRHADTERAVLLDRADTFSRTCGDAHLCGQSTHGLMGVLVCFYRLQVRHSNRWHSYCTHTHTRHSEDQVVTGKDLRSRPRKTCCRIRNRHSNWTQMLLFKGLHWPVYISYSLFGFKWLSISRVSLPLRGQRLVNVIKIHVTAGCTFWC